MLRPPAWELEHIASAWPAWAASLTPEVASKIAQFLPVAIEGTHVLVVEPPVGYNWLIDVFERADLRPKVESSLCHWLDRPVELRMKRVAEAKAPPAARHPGAVAKDDGLKDEPLIQFLVEKFDAKAVRVEADEEPNSSG